MCAINIDMLTLTIVYQGNLPLYSDIRSIMGQIAPYEYQIDEKLTFDNQFAINAILNQREDSS